MQSVVEATRGERRWAMLAHALTFSGMLIPLANLLAPALVGWLGRESGYVRFHARAALGFQASCMIYQVIFLAVLWTCSAVFQPPLIPPDGSWLVFWSVALAVLSLALLGLLWIVAVMGLVLHASSQALAGVCWHYPLTLRFLR